MTTQPVTTQRDPSDALRELCTIAPGFKSWWDEEEAEDRMVDGVHSDLTHHRLMIEFLDFFAKQHASFTAQQLRSLGTWVNQAVVVQDELGTAVATSFLQHSREVHVNKVLAPYLSAQAKGRSHA